MRKRASAASSRRDRVVLPAPDGEDNTRASPRRAIGAPPACSPASLNVLHLLAHLIDHGLELEPGAGHVRIVGLRAERVGLAVELLGQEVEAPARRLARGDE